MDIPHSYSLLKLLDAGYPLIEVLEDDKSFPSKPLRFGCGTAKLILLSMDVIREFVASNKGIETAVHTTRILSSAWQGYDIKATIESKPDFTGSRGETVYKPRLMLRVVPFKDLNISIGIAQAAALLALRQEIEAWANNECK